MPEQTSKFAAFIAELRQRRVFRVAAFYGGIAFVIFQIIDSIFEPLHIPEWVGSLLIVILLVGFPIAIALAWAFDITEQGIVRAKGRTAHAKRKAVPLIGNRALAIIAAVAIVVAGWGWLREPGGTALPEAPDQAISVLPLANLSSALDSLEAHIPRIAVLPLKNNSGDPEQDYFLSSMQDLLISELSKLSGFVVRSQQSTLQYRGSTQLIPEIAAKLQVDFLVEGTALIIGNEALFNLQLLTSEDENIWTEDYERDMTNVFRLLKDITKDVAEKINITLTPSEEVRLVTARQVTPEAFLLYQQGWYFRELQTRESIPKSVDYLEQAVAIDPTFAQAWAALAHAYVQMGNFSIWPLDQVRMKARDAAEQALMLDPELADAHVYNALYLYFFEYDWAGAEAAFERAIALNPNHLHAQYEYALFLIRMGRFDEAFPHAQKVEALDPISRRAVEVFRQYYAYSGQHDKAEEVIKRGMELYPDMEAWLPLIYFYSGRYEEGLELATRLGNQRAIMRFRMVMDQAPEAMAYFDSLEVVYKQVPGNETRIASPYIWRGDYEQALDWLERAVAARSIYITIKVAPSYFPLHDHPRFQAILREVGLE